MIFPEKSSQSHTSPLPHVKNAGSIGSRGSNIWANRKNEFCLLTNCIFWRMMPPYRQGNRFFRYSKKSDKGVAMAKAIVPQVAFLFYKL